MQLLFKNSLKIYDHKYYYCYFPIVHYVLNNVFISWVENENYAVLVQINMGHKLPFNEL